MTDGVIMQNENVSSAIVWASGARTIPASFYLTAKPAFLASAARSLSC